MAIRRDFSSTITRMHRVDYGKQLDANPGMGTAASAYMEDLTEKLLLVREEILANYRVGELGKEWCVSLLLWFLWRGS